jgi:hypothetical protein
MRDDTAISIGIVEDLITGWSRAGFSHDITFVQLDNL